MNKIRNKIYIKSKFALIILINFENKKNIKQNINILFLNCYYLTLFYLSCQFFFDKKRKMHNWGRVPIVQKLKKSLIEYNYKYRIKKIN